ncbi:hypothetical protein NQ176_g2442 [Zarea fungicola]|uniref:Uncharacterized protein n=1 Tax=Zarea fungicola TaxID=93591 RepID=A0ACC1NQG8_9HYPO|nr:hypothetical protein NQ176_g2442 [Lecanicillium fungicola]
MFSKLFLLAALSSSVVANNNLDVSVFLNSPDVIASGSSPQWNFPSGTCMPSPAIVNGKQDGGNAPDNCNILKLNHNCPGEPKSSGANTPLWSFPTYWDLQRCSQTEFRVSYNVYFTKDTGHRHDIEWIVVVWSSNDNGQTFYRNRVLFEQDGNKPSIQWGDLQNTFDSSDDQLSLGGKYKNHLRVFSGKFHHSMHHDRYTQFKSTCPPNSVSDYRTDDFYYWSNDNLVSVNTIPADWSYKPAAWARGNDICKY